MSEPNSNFEFLTDDMYTFEALSAEQKSIIANFKIGKPRFINLIPIGTIWGEIKRTLRNWWNLR
jgi:hypothetical protein